MESGDGFVEPFAGQVHQQVLEFAESAARLKGLFGRLHRLVRLHAFDEHERPPIVAVFADVITLPVAGRYDDERAARDVAGVRRFQPPADVRGHPHHVFHHRDGFFEHAPVDFLVDVTDPHSALVVGRGVGFVNVTDLERLGVKDFPVNLKLLRDLLKLLFLICHKPVTLCGPL